MPEKELPEIGGDPGARVRGPPVGREKEDLLAPFPGVKTLPPRTSLAELPELGSLTRREIASLAGLAPFTRKSGQWKGKSKISGGRATVRTALYMAALSAIRWNRPIKAYYQHLLAAGKSKMVALIAAARKILTILNAMIRDKTQWQPA